MIIVWFVMLNDSKILKEHLVDPLPQGAKLFVRVPIGSLSPTNDVVW